MELSDGVTVALRHAGELSGVPNARTRAIVGVTLENAPPAFLATSDEPSRLPPVHLQDRPWSAISWHVSGDEQAVDRRCGALEAWADSVISWYGGFATASRAALAVRSLAAGLATLLGVAGSVVAGLGA